MGVIYCTITGRTSLFHQANLTLFSLTIAPFEQGCSVRCSRPAGQMNRSGFLRVCGLFKMNNQMDASVQVHPPLGGVNAERAEQDWGNKRGRHAVPWRVFASHRCPGQSGPNCHSKPMVILSFVSMNNTPLMRWNYTAN